MADTKPPPLTVAARWVPDNGIARSVQVDSQQLHGRACVHCGSHMDGLVDAGHLYVGPGGWRAKACPHHTGEEAVA